LLFRFEWIKIAKMNGGIAM